MEKALHGDEFEYLDGPIDLAPLDDDVLRFLEITDGDFPDLLTTHHPLYLSSGDDRRAPGPPDGKRYLPPLASDAVDQYRPWELGTSCLNGNEMVEAVPTSWAPPASLDCSCCHVLREVVHTNGLKSMKLEIHGGLGAFYHAKLDVYGISQGFPQVLEQFYIDFSNGDFEGVKQFLVEYGLLRLQEQWLIEQDSISAFADALCTTMSTKVTGNGVREPCLPEPGLCQSRPLEALINTDQIRMTKTGIAAQRERTGKLRLKDLAEYFHLPIAEASKELNICSTAIKKICRRHGINRWPYRKEQIKSIDKTLSSLQKGLNSTSEQEVRSNMAKIEKLRTKRAKICTGQQS